MPGPPWISQRFRFVFADEQSVLAIKPTGELMRFPHWSTVQTTPRPTEGQQIGVGWADFVDVFAGGAGVIYAISADGALHWYKYTVLSDGPGGVTWRPSSGARIGQGWADFKWVFGGGDGLIYAVTSIGDLIWYRDLLQDGTNDPTGATGWAINSGSKIGRGWSDFRHIVSGGGGVIYTVDDGGALRWYDDVSMDGTNGYPPTRGWAADNGNVVGNGWNHFTHVFAGGPGQIFGCQSLDFGGYLAKYQDTLRNGSAAGWVTTSDPYIARSDAYFSAGWQVAKTEGYCWPMSIGLGETARFFVSTMNRGAAVAQLVRLTGRGPEVGSPLKPPIVRLFEADFQLDEGYGADCGWPAAFDLAAPDAPAGFYAARVFGPSGPYYDIPFINKRGPTAGNLAVVVNVNTWNAYNFWGGASNYSATASPIDLTHKRPNHHLLTNTYDHVNGTHMLRSEIWLVDWLQARGYSIDLLTDIDLHQNPGLSGYKAVIIGSHAEYWTQEMMAAIHAYLDGGGSLINLSGNIAYRPTTLRAQSPGGEIDLMSSQSTTWDPDQFATYGDMPLFAARPDLPNASGVGPGRGITVTPGLGFVPADAPRTPVGTTGWNGPPLGGSVAFGASGWETDVWPAPLPSGVLELGRDPQPQGAVLASYRTASGGFVFGVGSLTFVGSLAQDATLSSIVVNALADALSR